MTEWRFLDRAIILAIHEEQLAQHGGGVGLRDGGLLDSALARPVNTAAYNPEADAATLAAAYAFGIAKNHPFIDGNKRIAYVALEFFLDVNGYDFIAPDADSVIAMLGIASGDWTGDEFVAWTSDFAKSRG